MVKFTDTSGKEFAVSKNTISYMKDGGSDPKNPGAHSTVIYVGTISFIVAQSIDDVVSALNA